MSLSVCVSLPLRPLPSPYLRVDIIAVSLESTQIVLFTRRSKPQLKVVGVIEMILMKLNLSGMVARGDRNDIDEVVYVRNGHQGRLELYYPKCCETIRLFIVWFTN